jgi:hypothetical protein
METEQVSTILPGRLAKSTVIHHPTAFKVIARSSKLLYATMAETVTALKYVVWNGLQTSQARLVTPNNLPVYLEQLQSHFSELTRLFWVRQHECSARPFAKLRILLDKEDVDVA